MKQTATIIFRSVILLLAGMAIGLLIGNRHSDVEDADLPAPGTHKLDRVMQLVRKKYVDTIDADSVEGVTINNLLQKLDPHSTYLRQQQAQSLTEKLQGSFDGIGIESQLLRDTLFVTQVLRGGPAAKAGLPNGSRIITINNRPFSGTHLTTDRVSEAFEGKNDTGLDLGVLTGSGNKINSYHIMRGHISLSSLDAAYLTEPGVAYIKISKFGAATDDDFKTAMQKLKTNGMKKLVMDLRGNGGGYLNTATALADEFLPKGKLIVYTQGLHDPRTDYFATDSGVFEQGKLAVLIDEHSASASEILAGALQDLDRAIIVGRRSFGKGLVQEQFPFEDGSALNLTVARYYTPSGRSIQKSYKNGAESYRNDLNNRLQKGELYTAENNIEDSTAFNLSAPYHTESGKKVYGGGGIMPDIFVPEDAAINSLLIQDLNRNFLFTAYVLDHMQPLLKAYNNAVDFNSNYNVSDDELTHFIVYASGTLKEMDSHEINVARSYMKLLLKAHAGRFKWGNEVFYQIMNRNDEAIKKAIAALG
ncbi:S41 family peptidase [Mucilaginibacter robiniae]|uniref:S41 family peptidase n=1 Tax=Mucilaginibacter robiniae TaxID=2728022 RepID=A0A7L5E7E3_9SPHI|nr:S41 family peptidase [Mucilaginibacter robiniae]QJD96286.1 S41 family peptidase [Mucilaginibacter robiniae]